MLYNSNGVSAQLAKIAARILDNHVPICDLTITQLAILLRTIDLSEQVHDALACDREVRQAFDLSATDAIRWG